MIFLRIIAIVACIFCIEGRCASGDDMYENLKGRVAAQKARFLDGKPDFDKMKALLDDWLAYAHKYDADLGKSYNKLIYTIHKRYLKLGEMLKNNLHGDASAFEAFKEQLNAFIVDREMAVHSLKQRIAKIKESKFESRFKRYTAEILQQILQTYQDVAEKLRNQLEEFEKSMATKA